MKARQMLQVITGQAGGDDVAALTAELEAEKKKASEACGRLEWLERQEKTADSYEQARSLAEQIAELKWQIRRADVAIPHLEAKMQAALAERQRDGIARHQVILRKRYQKFRAALEAAVEQQSEVIREREAAAAELGEQVAQRHLPNIAYAGFLYRDLFQIWAVEQDRVFAERPKSVADAPRPAPAPVKPAEAEFGFGWTRRKPTDPPITEPEPPPRPKRSPRRDAAPTSGERRVQLLRTGLQLPDGSQGIAGDVITLTIERAELLVRNGAAEFVTEGAQP